MGKQMELGRRLSVSVTTAGQGPTARTPWRSDDAEMSQHSPQMPRLAQLWGAIGGAAQILLALALSCAALGSGLAGLVIATGGAHLQDGLLILCTAAGMLLLVLHALLRENAFEVAVVPALAALSATQLIILAASLGEGQGAAKALAALLVLLQAAAAGLAYPTWHSFGWRMWSRMPGDLRRTDAAECRRALCKRDLFAALAKLDMQAMLLMLVVALANAPNASGSAALPLLAAAAVAGVVTATVWLLAAAAAVRAQRERWVLAAEFGVPLCYVAPLLIIFEAVSSSATLGQAHGRAYLILYPILFMAAQTAVWVQLRLLGREFAALRKALARAPAATAAGAAAPDLPRELLPLVQGAWLWKLPSGSDGCTRVGCGAGGRYRFFQLSHDGSSLRWSWDRFVLLYHVEDLTCSADDLTITLHLLLEHDLRLQAPDRPTFEAWQQGLRLLLRLLVLPQGLPGASGPARAGSGLPKEWVLQLGAGAEGHNSSGGSSPSRMLRQARRRRACTTSLTREQLRLAAEQSRAALAAHGSAQGGGSCRSGARPSNISGSEGGASSIGRNSFSEPAESPGAAGRSRDSSNHRRPKAPGTLAWLRRTVALRPSLFRSHSDSGTSGHGSPSKLRLTDHPEHGPDGSDSDGSFWRFEREACARLAQEAPPRSRRHRSLSVDMEWSQAGAPLGAAPAFSSLQYGRWEGPPAGPGPGPGEAGAGAGAGSLADPGSLPLSELSSVQQAPSRAHSRQSTVHSRRSSNASLPSLHTYAVSAPDPAVLDIGRLLEQPAAEQSQKHSSLTPEASLECFQAVGFGPALSVEVSEAEGGQAPAGDGGGCYAGPGERGAAGQQGVAAVEEAGAGAEAVRHRRVVSISICGVPSVGDLEALPAHHQQQPTASASGFAFLTASESWSAIQPHENSETQYAAPAPAPAQLALQQEGAQQWGGLAPAAPLGALQPGVPAGFGSLYRIPEREAQAQEGLGATAGRLATAPTAGSSYVHLGSMLGVTSHLPLGSIAGGSRGSSAEPTPRDDISGGSHSPAGLLRPPHQGGAIPAALLPAGSGVPGPAGSLGRGNSDGFSSWGLPTPTSAHAVGGLSRLSSLLLAHHSDSSGAPSPLDPNQAPAAQHGGGSGWSGAGSISPSAPPGPLSLRSLGIIAPVEAIEYEEIIFGRLLGEGSEGPVHAAWYRETPVAVKRTRSLAEVEMSIHAGSHDNVVALRGLCKHGSHYYLVMELCPRGTLDVLIHASAHKLDPLKLLPIVRSIARGMLHLHSRKPAILHRDLKPANVFIGHGYVVKVGDLGMSRYATGPRVGVRDGLLERTLTPGVIGTAAYCAPEVLAPESPVTAQATADPERLLKADVYSFGVTLYELVTRTRPHEGMDGFQVQTQWFLEPEAMRLPPITLPESLTPQGRHVMQTLAGLVQSCTALDPGQRPSFREILGVLRSATGGESAPSNPAGSVGAGAF